MTQASSSTLYRNARIFTVDAAMPWADALLVEGGRVKAIGTEADIAPLAGDCPVVDLDGRMVMPGIHDAHTHLLAAGLKFRHECRLGFNPGAKEIVSAICDCQQCQRTKLSGWIIGGEFNPLKFGPGELDREFLDEAFPDTAIFLFDYSIHHGFANSRALELAGIEAATSDPAGGRIVRREGSSEPTGELVERATWAVRRAIPPYSADVYEDAVVWAMKTSNRFGITSVQEASGALPELEVLKRLDEQGKLSLKVTAHLVWREEAFSGGCSQDEMDALIARHADFATDNVRTHFVKCWMDGAPVPPHFTQSGLLPETGKPDESKLVISEEELVEGLTAFEAKGLSVKIHCAAEGSVQTALNAIERVRKANGGQGPRHEIAHALFVAPVDLPRFEALRVTAEMSPAVWHIRTPEFAGLDHGCKFATLDRAGALVTIGSDWILVEDPNLFPALQGMVERGEESVPLPLALEMMTLAGAKSVGLNDQSGSLTAGKSADFIVLDRNLFDVPTSSIGETKVLMTVFQGRTVFSADE